MRLSSCAQRGAAYTPGRPPVASRLAADAHAGGITRAGESHPAIGLPNARPPRPPTQPSPLIRPPHEGAAALSAPSPSRVWIPQRERCGRALPVAIDGKYLPPRASPLGGINLFSHTPLVSEVLHTPTLGSNTRRKWESKFARPMRELY